MDAVRFGCTRSAMCARSKQHVILRLESERDFPFPDDGDTDKHVLNGTDVVDADAWWKMFALRYALPNVSRTQTHMPHTSRIVWQQKRQKVRKTMYSQHSVTTHANDIYYLFFTIILAETQWIFCTENDILMHPTTYMWKHTPSHNVHTHGIDERMEMTKNLNKVSDAMRGRKFE